MAYERAKEYLKSKGLEDHIIIPEHSSATVAEAAEALGCEPGMIAKTLSFLQGDKAVLILAEGMARIDNKKYKARFGCNHDVGGVCPFGVNPDVTIYLDESLKQHATVYPAAGTDHSAVRLTIEELELACNDAPWIDVCKDPDAEDSLS